MKKLIIAIDFDGTICSVGTWPEVGNLLPGARRVIAKWVNQGHTIIINTLREREYADMAKVFLLQNEIFYHFFNENTSDGIEKYYDSRKIGADVYIDDRSLFMLAFGVDWERIDGFMDYIIREMNHYTPEFTENEIILTK